MPATAVITTRPPVTFDAEYHIGLIAEDSSDDAMNYNQAVLNDALAGMYRNGNVTLAHGGDNSLLRPISFSSKTFYIRGPIKTAARLGGGLLGTSSWGSPATATQFADASTIGGARSRLVIENDDGYTKAAIRIRGGGFVIDSLDIHGRTEGGSDLASSCIEIEAKSSVDCGRQVIRNCSLSDATAGIELLDGYYDENESFVSYTSGASGSIIENITGGTASNIIKTTSQIAKHWRISNIFASSSAGQYAMTIGSWTDYLSCRDIAIETSGSSQGLLIGTNSGKALRGFNISGAVIGSVGAYGINCPYPLEGSNIDLLVSGFTNGVYFGNSCTLTANKIHLRGPAATTIRWPDATTGTFGTPNVPDLIAVTNQLVIMDY